MTNNETLESKNNNNKLYMVWVKGGGRPKKIHATLEIAQNEAARLANINPTQNVYVVEIVSVIEATVIVESAAKPVVTPKPVEVDKVKSTNTLSLPKKNVTA